MWNGFLSARVTRFGRAVLLAGVVAAGPAALGTGAGQAHGQAPHSHGERDTAGSSGAETVAGVPRAFLERPIALNESLALVPHAGQAVMPEALAYYQQGLSYHYLYHHLNAVRSFHEALRLDPALLPAYAGLSRALTGLGARSDAEAVIARAREVADELGDAADSPGRLLVELRSQALSTSTDEDRSAYGEALSRALDRSPDDIEVRMLWALSARGGERIDRLHGVLERVPDHVGAHHQLVHAYEMSGRTREAVEHGAILAELAPTVAHGRHMFGHSLIRSGRVAEAMHEFAIADSLERAYFAAEEIPEHYDWHHPHNLHLLALTYWHQGRTTEAEAVLRRRAELEGPEGEESPSRLVQLGEFQVAEGRGREALKVARRLLDSEESGNLPTWLRVQGHLLEAEARLLAGELEEARAALAAAEDLRSGAGRGAFGVGRWMTRVEMQLLLHSGMMDEESEGLEEVLADLRRDRGPDGWITSLLHLHALAQSARAAGAAQVADRVIQAIGEHDPAFRVRVSPPRTDTATGPRSPG